MSQQCSAPRCWQGAWYHLAVYEHTLQLSFFGELWQAPIFDSSNYSRSYSVPLPAHSACCNAGFVIFSVSHRIESNLKRRNLLRFWVFPQKDTSVAKVCWVWVWWKDLFKLNQILLSAPQPYLQRRLCSNWTDCCKAQLNLQKEPISCASNLM